MGTDEDLLAKPAPPPDAPPAAVLSAAVEASADAVVCHDPAGTVLTWNAAAERLYGRSAADVVGRPLPPFGAGAAREELLRAWAAALEGRRTERFDSAHCHADGHRLDVSVTTAPVRVGGAVVAVATTVTDVGERVRVVQELDALQARLEKQNAALTRSNRDLEQFAYVASHDLSEPLRVMSGYVELLERRYTDLLDDRGRRYVHHVVEASLRMRALIDDLLDYSRFLREPRAVVPVDTDEVLRQVLKALGGSLRSSGAVVDVGSLPRVLSDPTNLHSLLLNLVGNALKFSHPGAVPHVSVSAEQRDGLVHLAVDDDGIGIAPEYRERVFRMFQRLHAREEYGGTGIGLAIARQIVDLHEGGRLEVHDSPLGGARLLCVLPGADPDPGPSAEEDPS